MTKDHVMGIPPGDATGSAFSGEYQTTRYKVEGCRCGTLSCATLTANVGEVIQMDGALQLVEPISGDGAAGGVNADGTFHLAYLREDVGNIQYVLADRRFTVSGDTPVSIELVQEATGVNGGIACDVRMRASLAYLGPLRAALAEGSLGTERGKIFRPSRRRFRFHRRL